MEDHQVRKLDPQPEPEESPQTARYYSNYTGISVTSEEFVLRFSERDMKDPDKVIETARIYLGLPHAKRLVIAMARSLKAHEATFGEIITDPVAALDPETKKKLGITE